MLEDSLETGEVVVEWFSDSSQHGDDHVDVFETGGMLVVVVCDGVSESRLGRLAAVLTCKAVRDEIKGMSSLDVDELEALVRRVGDGLRGWHEKLIQWSRPSQELVRVEEEYGRWSVVKRKFFDGAEALKDYFRHHKWVSETIGKLEALVDKRGEELMRKKKDLEGKVAEYKEDFTEILRDARVPDEVIEEKWGELTRSGDAISAKTTLSVAVLHGTRLGVIVCGDSPVRLFRRVGSVWRGHAFEPTGAGGKLDVYMSLEEGLVGKPFVALSKLEPGDVLVVATDGAQIEYARRGGYPGVMFHKSVVQNPEPGAPKRWFETLVKGGAVTDDYSLVVVRRLPHSHGYTP